MAKTITDSTNFLTITHATGDVDIIPKEGLRLRYKGTRVYLVCPTGNNIKAPEIIDFDYTDVSTPSTASAAALAAAIKVFLDAYYTG